jgi:hypothetical protein
VETEQQYPYEEGLGDEENPMNVDPNRKRILEGQTVSPNAILPGTLVPVVKDMLNSFQTGALNPKSLQVLL